jgi:hypothetical protein
MAYEGIAVATDLMRTNLPACERVFARQPSTLNFTFSMILRKADLLEFPNRGERQYVQNQSCNVRVDVSGEFYRGFSIVDKLA